MEQPVVKWVPSIAPSGMAKLKSAQYGASWQGSFFIGSLKFGYLERVEARRRRPCDRAREALP